jgi:hypothetical protein
MTEIKTIKPPSVSDGSHGMIRPEDSNPEMAAAAMLRRLLDKWPTPAISSKKFTVIHGLMISLNHTEDNQTYLDTSRLVSLMDCVEHKSVNEDGFLPKNLFAYLMHPTYIIQGMPQLGQVQEQKRGLISSLWGRITGKEQQTTQAGVNQ